MDENRLKELDEYFEWILTQKCCVCGEPARGMGDGNPYCDKHWAEAWWKENPESWE